MASEPQKDNKRLLIVGGYGAFGGRLAEMLLHRPRLTIFIAGRSIERAKRYCESQQTKAQLVPALFDRTEDNAGLIEQLTHIAPDIVVDASGPFQTYGDDPYALISACVDLGINYLDLADSADFVLGIARFNDRAVAKGLFVISGASTLPALSGAVLRELTKDMSRLDRLYEGIAPSPHALMGESVVRAVASYAGQPLTLRRDGKESIAAGLTESKCFTIAPPGKRPLLSRRFSLAEGPDLRLMAQRYPELSSTWVGAGTVPEILHLLLNALAKLVSHGGLPKLDSLAPLMHRVMQTVRWGEHRGGMFVLIEGLDQSGYAVANSWHLIAEGDDGPYIPSMAAQILVSNTLNGSAPKPGARAADEAILLTDFYGLFSERKITHGTRCENIYPQDPPPYAAVLGNAISALPTQVVDLHTFEGALHMEGDSHVERSTHWLARFVGWVMRFPAAGANIPTRVKITRTKGIETWQRHFGEDHFQSEHSLGRKRYQHLVVERFGLLRFGLALTVADNELHMELQRWSAMHIPLPRLFAPKIVAREGVKEALFAFHVEISLPLVGQIVSYRGQLAPRQ